MSGRQTEGMRAATAGLPIALISAATFGTSGTFADTLMASGWSPGGAVTARIALAASVLTIPGVIALRGRWHRLRSGWSAIGAYGMLAVAGCQYFFFNAVEHLSVGVALLLEYSGTLLVVLWMWLRHHQRPARLTVIGGVVAIAGLVLVLDLTGPQRVDLVGVLWGLGAATGLATFFVISARSSDGDDSLPPIAMAWAGMTVAAVALGALAVFHAIPFRVATRDVELAGHTVSWAVPVIGVALLSTVIGYTTGIAAARRLGARVASFVGLAEVLFAILFAWLLVHQRPDAIQLVGGVVVIVGIALVRVDDRGPGDAPAGAADLQIPLAGASS